MLQRFLDPQVLASISSLDLVAKTVVDGFVAGLHRSPSFGFSQEFAEYRQYTEGDDLRHVDWNVYARTERIYLKRFKGETNSQLLVLLDASASMTYKSANISKLDYARYMALHAIEQAEGGARTNFTKPFTHFQEFLRRRGIVVVFSDFYADPTEIIKVIEPLRYRGNEVIMFHLLDPNEIAPKFRDPVLLLDSEDDTAMEISPEYARNEYRDKMGNHRKLLADKAAAAGLEYVFMDTSKPLDQGLRNYLAIRQRRS